MTARFQIVEQEPGRWIIVHASDPGLVWSGGYWADREQRGVHPIGFTTEAEAETYAKTIWSQS
jgi:hypothetical protein